ncbi:MAG: pyruvate dehydrogenase complex dihydrolipoamide acetyltransferase [Novosphingobium sp.]
MSIEIKMPALSPTMEQGKLARWLVKEGDTVASGDLLAEIETDKATMEFEAVDEGTILSLAVPAGADNIKVGTVIATLSGDDEDQAPPAPVAAPPAVPASAPAPAPVTATPAPPPLSPPATPIAKGDRVIASPLAKRLAAEKGVDLAAVAGSGPNGRIVQADVEAAEGGTAPKPAAEAPASVAVPSPAAPAAVEMTEETRLLLDPRIPHSVEKLSGMRKTIARRLAQSMQTAPHIYLTVDVRLDKLLALRAELNEVLAKQGVKLSVNDLLIKALAKALIEVPACNVAFAGNELIRYDRADISVAVSIPGGLITPIVSEADSRSLSSIALAMNDLGTRAKEGKLKPDEYQGGTASLSNMGMLGIKQFTAVINPPQATILAIGAGEKRPWVMPDGTLGVASVMSATGSFDHRAVDGADGARLMGAFKELCERPLGLVA